MTKIMKIEDLSKDKKIDLIKYTTKDMINILDTNVSSKIKCNVEVLEPVEKVIMNIVKDDIVLTKKVEEKLLLNTQLKEELDDSK